jgi:hypothetical protein
MRNSHSILHLKILGLSLAATCYLPARSVILEYDTLKSVGVPPSETKPLSAFISQLRFQRFSAQAPFYDSKIHNEGLYDARKVTVQPIRPVPAKLHRGLSPITMCMHTNDNSAGNATASTSLCRPPWEAHLESMAGSANLTASSPDGGEGTDVVVIGKIIIDEFVLRCGPHNHSACCSTLHLLASL